MSRTFNMVRGSGPKATLLVTVTNGTATSVTATKDGSSISLIQTGGTWFAVLPSFGTWTVTITDGTHSNSATVNASTAGLYAISIYMPDVPIGYTQLEYIESTTGQVINTGIVPNKTTKIVDTVLLTQTNSYQRIFGAKGNTFDVERYDTDGKFYCELYGNPSVGSGEIYVSNNTVLVVTLDASKTSNNYSINSTVRSASRGSTTPTTPIYLSGKLASDGTTRYNSYLRRYSCVIYSGASILRNYVPARRNVDAVVGLYDKANNVFYVNIGTGTFIAGPAV